MGGDKGNEGKKGDKGDQGQKGGQGQKGEKGNQGQKGEKGDQGQKGEKGAEGQKGDKGERGKKGNDGMGLNEKSFKLKQTYNKGDYVFSRSSSDSKKHTMYTAQSTFTAEKEPYKDTNTSHWVEFTAPQGERGEKGDQGEKGDKGNEGQKGDQGERGKKGNDGMGLKEKMFKLKQTYNKGDYVFSRSSSNSKKHTMYTAQSTFTAEEEPY